MDHDPVDSGVLAALALLFGATFVLHPVPVVFVASAVVLPFVFGPARVASRGVVVLVALLAIGGAVRARSAIRQREVALEASGARLPRPARCFVHGTVVSMPLERGALRADVDVDRLDCGEGDVLLDAPFRARLYQLEDDVARGDIVEAVVQLAPARAPRVPELGVSASRPSIVASGSAITSSIRLRGSGLLARLDHLRARLRRAIHRVFPPDLSGMARALVLGEEDLAAEDDAAFRDSGLTHLLAVSGTHVALVVGGLVAALRAALVRLLPNLARAVDVGRVAAAVGVPLALAYEQLAGDSGSARRATAMALAFLVARAAGRAGDRLRAFALSILAALVVDPLAPTDLSFVLSLAATGGLLWLGRPLDRVLGARLPRLPRWLRSPIVATVAASVACAPVVATLAGGIPLVGVAANVVAVPLGELAALPLVNVAALLGASPFPRLGEWIGHAAAGALVLLRGCARVAAAPKLAVLPLPPPTSAQLALLAAAVALVLLARLRGWTLVALACSTLALFVLLERVEVGRGAPSGRLRVTVLDVGQGDSLLVDFPDGRAMLVDAGGEVGSPYDPGAAVVARVLAARRRTRLDVVVLSHPHPDHFLGLAAALRRVDVGEFWDTGQGETEGAGASYTQLLAGLRARHVRVVRPDAVCAGPRAFGGATVEVLAPCPSFAPDLGANDNSFVLRLGYGARHALLVGDAEREAERSLVATYGQHLHADFLKVGHHGSRTSSSLGFLDAVAPSIAAISCGARNRFGHPHALALENLVLAGARVFRTDRDGSITWSTDGTSSDLVTAAAAW